MRLAVLESNELTGELLTFSARRQRHSVITVQGVDELRRALPFTPTVVLMVQRSESALSVDQVSAARTSLPGASVLVVAEALDSRQRADLIRSGVHEIVEGKFDPYELMSRLSSWERRPLDSDGAGQQVEVGDLLVDAERYLARKNGADLVMTPLEIRLLYCMAAHSPNVTPAERLLSFGWGALEDPVTSLIRTHICHIRRKLERAGGLPVEIRSKHTLGYTLSIAGGGPIGTTN